MSDDNVSKVSIKAAEFCETTASGWFHILEAQFHLSNITNEGTKFFHALAALPASIVSKLSPTTLNNQIYTTLKNQILELVEQSKPEVFDSLLGDQTITGKPSMYLAALRKTGSKRKRRYH